jgi:large subunit ribosomal protein L17
MRHRKKTIKLGRATSHREAMLANMVCSLIKEKRITTTLPKARAARSIAEKMVTLGKTGTLHTRRLAVSRLHDKDSVQELFTAIAPALNGRAGGYTRITKLGKRRSDASEMAILEWVDVTIAPAETAVAAE